MNRITKILLTSAIVGILAVPLISFAACGARPLCSQCATEELCLPNLLCYWTGAACANQTISEISSANITTAVGYMSGLFSDAKLLILLAIGLPVGFIVIRQVMAIVVGRKK